MLCSYKRSRLSGQPTRQLILNIQHCVSYFIKRYDLKKKRFQVHAGAHKMKHRH